MGGGAAQAHGGWSRRRFVGALGALGGTVAAGVSVAGCGSGGAGGSGGEAAGEGGGSASGSPSAPEAGGASSAAPSRPSSSTPRPLYLGTYTSAKGGGQGIGIAAYDPSSGRITRTGTLTGVPDPSYLAAHPDGRTLYAVNERSRGTVTAVRIADREILGTRATGGAHPCHLSVHPGGRWLLSADYGSGSVAVHPIDASGALGERTDMVTHRRPAPGPGQQGPHAHQFVTAPDGSHVLAVDLGTDTVYSYRLDERTGTLREVAQAHARPGAGPRHLVFHPDGRFAYLANESDDTVTVCAYDPSTGRLTIGAPQSTGSPPGVTNYPAQLVVSPDGGHAYLANRGANTLARYAVESDGARLRLLGTVPVAGDFPRQLALAPDGRLLFAANQRSSTVSVFHVTASSGELRLADKPFTSPVAVCALPL